jgi:hypothetical protein
MHVSNERLRYLCRGMCPTKNTQCFKGYRTRILLKADSREVNQNDWQNPFNQFMNKN